jgi:hypothetical protein
MNVGIGDLSPMIMTLMMKINVAENNLLNRSSKSPKGRELNNFPFTNDLYSSKSKIALSHESLN